jgi:peroxiredoxin family protein
MSALVAAIVATTAMAAGVGYSVYAGEEGRKAQKEAMNRQRAAQAQAAQQAKEQATASQAAMRRAQGQAPDVAGIMAAAQEGAAGGPAATMLTGPMGIDPNQLSLGRNTLLGG